PALHGLFDFAAGLVDGRHDEILEHRGVVLVHHLGIDLDRDQLLVAAHLDRDHTAADACLDHGLRQLAVQPLLHLLRLFHQLLHTAHVIPLSSRDALRRPRPCLGRCPAGSAPLDSAPRRSRLRRPPIATLPADWTRARRLPSRPAPAASRRWWRMRPVRRIRAPPRQGLRRSPRRPRSPRPWPPPRRWSRGWPAAAGVSSGRRPRLAAG